MRKDRRRLTMRAEVLVVLVVGRGIRGMESGEMVARLAESQEGREWGPPELRPVGTTTRRPDLVRERTAPVVEVVEMSGFSPGSANGEAVEIGVDRIWVEFGPQWASSGPRPCGDAPVIAMCASTTIEKKEGESRSFAASAKLSSTRMRCWNASSVTLSTNEANGAARASVDLSADKITAFDATTTVVVEEGAFCSGPRQGPNGTELSMLKNGFATWTFRTVSAPEVMRGVKTANTTVATNKYHVYGLGVFMNDVATIDVGAGTFYGDVSIYALRYYRPFANAKTAIEEATVSSPFGRECAMQGTDAADKWLLLKKFDPVVDDVLATTAGDRAASPGSSGSSGGFPSGLGGPNPARGSPGASNGRGRDGESSSRGPRRRGKRSGDAKAASDGEDDDAVTVTDEGRFVVLVNAGKFPKVEVEYRADDFDHVRVRTEFYFEPTLRSYPFQRQTLPVTLELASDVLRQTPSKLLCLLTPYSGFAPKLSSFSAAENEDRVLTASAVVDEAPRAPPFPSCDRAQFQFPRGSPSPGRLRGGHAFGRVQQQASGGSSSSSSSLPGSSTTGFIGSASTGEGPSTSGGEPDDVERGEGEEESNLLPVNPCAPKRSTSRLSLNIVYEPPTRVGAMVLLPSGLIGAGALVSYALNDPVSRLQTLATSLLAAVVQHASIRSGLPPRSVVTTADEFAFSVYAVVAVATAASFLIALDNSRVTRNFAGCAGAASIVFFLHAKRPAGLDLAWEPACLAFVLIFVLLAALVQPDAALAACGLRAKPDSGSGPGSGPGSGGGDDHSRPADSKKKQSACRRRPSSSTRPLRESKDKFSSGSSIAPDDDDGRDRVDSDDLDASQPVSAEISDTASQLARVGLRGRRV